MNFNIMQSAFSKEYHLPKLCHMDFLYNAICFFHRDLFVQNCVLLV